MKTPPCAARSTDDFYESICHNDRRCLWSAHSDACLACLRGRPAPGEGPLVHSHHGRRRRAMSLGLAPAQALFALVMLKAHASHNSFAFWRILTLPPERRPPVRRHCPVLRRNRRVGDRRSASGCPRWWQCQDANLLFGRRHPCLTRGGVRADIHTVTSGPKHESSEGLSSSQRWFTASQAVCLYADRIAGGDRHYRHIGGIAPAGPGEIETARAVDQMYQQRQTNYFGRQNVQR